MSEQLVIEPARFARERGQRTGTLKPARLSRLAESLGDAAGTVGYSVSGYMNERGFPTLHVEVDAALHLRCQRCLGSLAQRVRSQREIVLVPGADEFAQRDDEGEAEDVIPEVPRLDLATLIEDEVLLALPLAARHEEDACEVAETQPEVAQSPFAALARLKR